MYSSWMDESDSDDLSSDAEDEPKLNSNNFKCHLYAIIAYYGKHYLSFIKSEKWYIWDDSKVKELPEDMSLKDYFKKHKLIPYVVYYGK